MDALRATLDTYVVYRRLSSGSRERLNTVVAPSEDNAIERARQQHGQFIEVKRR